MRRKLKNKLSSIFGFGIVLIVTLFFLSCIIYSDRKENFFSWFSNDKKIPTYNEIQLLNPDIKGSNYQNQVKVNDAEYRPVVNGKPVLPPTKRGTMRPGISEEGQNRDKPLSSTSDVNTLQCQMSNECQNGYYFTGAQFSGNMMSCQNNNINSARAVASIKNGMIENIHVIDGGKGYTEPPKVSILGGNGMGAVGKCILKDSKIDKIKLTNTGYNYTSTPQVTIEQPNVTCKLCCKK